MQISTRRANAEDEPFIRLLITESIAATLGVSSCPEPMRSQIVDIQYSARRMSARGNFPNGKDSIILVDGESAGWIYHADLPEEIRLVEIMVARVHRGKGVGTAVISALLAEVEKTGKPIRLSVDVTNTGAIRLYERLGFRCVDGDELRHLMEKGSQ